MRILLSLIPVIMGAQSEAVLCTLSLTLTSQCSSVIFGHLYSWTEA
jgi:hypothetical protein